MIIHSGWNHIIIDGRIIYFFMIDKEIKKHLGVLPCSPEAHLSIVVSNLRAIGFTFKGKEYQAIVDSTVDPVAKLVQYNNTNIIDALTKIAEAWECEWWVDGDKIYLGHLEHGEPVNLEIGKEIDLQMSRSQSQDIFATRLYAFGSSRIPSLPTIGREKRGQS